MKQCCFGRKIDVKAFHSELADNEWVQISAKDDEAAINLLSIRGFIEALEAEWPEPDEGWLDRVVIGRLSRRQKKNVMPGDFLGLMLLSNATPLSAVNGEQPRTTALDGVFIWSAWMGRYPDLKVDQLHLLPLNGDSEIPIESIDLGKLNAPAQMLQLGENSEDFALMLDYGTSIDELVCSGREQAMRWNNGVKAALLQTLAHGASELDAEVLVEELQKYDGKDEKRRVDEAHHAQHKLITDFAQSQHDDPDTTWDPFNQRGNILDWHSPLHEKVKVLLDSKEHEVDLQALLETCSRIATMPRLLVTAAVRREPIRKDVLEFWKDEYHVKFCASIETLWKERVKVMSCSELAGLADAINQYKSWLTSVYIEDPSLHAALLEAAEVYARRTYPSLTSLAQNVAELAIIHKKKPDGSGGYCTSAPEDMLQFLGGVSEVALEGPEEMRLQAAKVVDGACYRYKKQMKKQIQDVQDTGNVGLLFIHFASMVMDAEDFAWRLQRMLDEAAGDKQISDTVFHTVEGRFREAAEVYCERLVSITLQQVGAVKEFGNPPTANKVWETDLKQLVREVLMPAMGTLQDMLGEPWRSRFACKLIARFVAFEIYVLLYKRDGITPPSAAQVSKMLQAQAAELKTAAAQWVNEEHLKLAESRANALGDISAILSIGADKLELIVHGVTGSHSGAFTKDLALKVLELRPELTQEQRNKAVGKAPQDEPTRKENARRSYLATDETQSPLKQGSSGSPFEYVVENAWAEHLISQASSWVGSGGGPKWTSDWVRKGEKALKAEIESLADPSGRSKHPHAQHKTEDDAPNIDDFLADIDLSDDDEEEEAAPAAQVPVAGTDPAASSAAPGKAAKPKQDDEFKSDSELWSSEDSFKPDEDEDDDDDGEVVRGYLWKKGASIGDETVLHVEEDKGLMGKMKDKLKDASKGAFKRMKGGWEKKFFMVTQDMRQHRTLCWYSKMTDLVAEGSLFLSEMGKVTCDQDTSNKKLGFLVKIQILDVQGEEADVLELRTEYEREQQLWQKKLTVLLERQLAAYDMVTEREGIVYKLPPCLKIRDPDRLGVASKKIFGRAAAASKIRKLGMMAGSSKQKKLNAKAATTKESVATDLQGALPDTSAASTAAAAPPVKKTSDDEEPPSW